MVVECTYLPFTNHTMETEEKGEDIMRAVAKDRLIRLIKRGGEVYTKLSAIDAEREAYKQEERNACHKELHELLIKRQDLEKAYPDLLIGLAQDTFNF